MAVLQGQELVFPGTDGLARNLEVCWHTETHCCGAAEVAEHWSLGHYAAAAAAAFEKASAADVGESSLSPHLHQLHLPCAETGGEGGVEEAAHSEVESHRAAVEQQVLDPCLAVGLEALSELGSEELGAGSLQTLAYLVLWCHCFPAMEAQP